MTKFQIIVLALFIIAIIGGAASFALYKGSNNTPTLPNITIWGTFPATVFDKYISDINNSTGSSLKLLMFNKDHRIFLLLLLML